MPTTAAPALTTRRHRPGLYEVRGLGYWVEQAADEEGRVYGWHLLSPTGEWMQTYTTKAAALDDLAVWLDGPA